MKSLRNGALRDRIEAHVPSPIFLELATPSGRRRGSPEDAVSGVRVAMSIGLVFHDLEGLPDRAAEVPLERDLAVYDPVRATLARSLGATPVT